MNTSVAPWQLAGKMGHHSGNSVPVSNLWRHHIDGLRDGPFHTALRAAIHARSLTLDRLCERLADQGVRVSVSSLSNWQRGVSRPERPETLRALALLEEILGLRCGDLARLLGAPRRGRWPESGQGTSRVLANRLRAELDATEPGVRVLGIQEELVVGADPWPWQVDTRIVVRATTSGVDRHVVLSHSSDGGLPRLRAGRTCRLGRVRTDPAAGLTAAELLFGALTKGETYPVEYHLDGTVPEAYHGTWFRAAGQNYELTVRFDPAARVRSAHRIWRLDARSPHKDVAELRLIDGHLAHLIDFDLAPGFHGIRWVQDI
ncbi:hypothetical protein Lfu02_65900 [Longispora fulva]|uniref:Transcriptional regulator with XRE-family HTH domain n=1 Tax=Longispora fulva TaxID=619741 RepID=A0A8J7GRZ7_9ACTN|nr:hypothetical protein [Longispora fulva]MBG6137624.1 transcriptional regulator with XRE-family HTH domain [Longispora fulva]GIG62218.1 hypothetical protein Lfu02_65900 [Longispora fulva]